jgi:hypothetical protein
MTTADDAAPAAEPETTEKDSDGWETWEDFEGDADGL